LLRRKLLHVREVDNTIWNRRGVYKKRIGRFCSTSKTVFHFKTQSLTG
jgi:hypothetical protein